MIGNKDLFTFYISHKRFIQENPEINWQGGDHLRPPSVLVKAQYISVIFLLKASLTRQANPCNLVSRDKGWSKNKLSNLNQLHAFSYYIIRSYQIPNKISSLGLLLQGSKKNLQSMPCVQTEKTSKNCQKFVKFKLCQFSVVFWSFLSLK